MLKLTYSERFTLKIRDYPFFITNNFCLFLSVCSKKSKAMRKVSFVSSSYGNSIRLNVKENFSEPGFAINCSPEFLRAQLFSMGGCSVDIDRIISGGLLFIFGKNLYHHLPKLI